ncbi:hypothetical protein [Ferrimicrobium acidiphilum]|uniref:hypothetical protein n=1 Tax=Ferrimicrobium acidiphilum TaxID=121039 RepID=UPI0023F54A27|nr:hypothetical protein [Ferrimicrobium acidiphilum]
MSKKLVGVGVSLVSLLLGACGTSQVATATMKSPSTVAQNQYLSIYNGVPSAVPASVQQGGPVRSLFLPDLLRIPQPKILKKEVLDVKNPYINGVWVGTGNPNLRLDKYSTFLLMGTTMLLGSSQLANINDIHGAYVTKYMSFISAIEHSLNNKKYNQYALPTSALIANLPGKTGAGQWFLDKSLVDYGGVWQAILAMNNKRTSHWTVTPELASSSTKLTECFRYPRYYTYTSGDFLSGKPIANGVGNSFNMSYYTVTDSSGDLGVVRTVWSWGLTPSAPRAIPVTRVVKSC